MPDAQILLRFVLGLLSHLAPGRALTREPGSSVYQLATGLATELARVQEKVDGALREMIPWQAVDMLPDWEALLGITAPATLLADRQAAVRARLMGDGPPTLPGFEALAASLGYTLEWRRAAPFVCGVARMGQRIGGGRRIYTWEVRYTAGGANDALLEELLHSYAGGHGGGKLAITAVQETPPHASLLQLWLDPAGPDTSVVSGAVAQLGDRSGHGRHFTQATATQRPAFNTVDARFGRRPTLTFDGVDDWMSCTASFALTPSGIATIFTVLKADAAHTGQVFAGAGGSTRAITYRLAGDYGHRYEAAGAYRQRRPTVGDVPVRLAVIVDATNASAQVPAEWVNGTKNSGVLQTSGSPAASGFPSGTPRIGSSGASQWLNGTIAEVLVFDGALTDGEVAEVDTWLADRYRRWVL